MRSCQSYVLLVILVINLLNVSKIATSRVDTLFERLNGYKKASTRYSKIINGLKEELKLYAFLEIGKSPPQPSNVNDRNYFKSNDIMSELSKIDTSDSQTVYEFNRQAKTAIAKFRDLHIAFVTDLEDYDDIYVFSPLSLYVKEVDGSPKMFGKENIINYSILENGEEVEEKIKANLDNPIKTINGMSPFDYIQNLGGEINSLHNEHATYTNKLYHHEAFRLSQFYLSQSELNKFEVEYENDNAENNKFSTTYGIIDTGGKIFSKTNLYSDEETNEKFSAFLKEEKDKEKKRLFRKNLKKDGLIFGNVKERTFKDFIKKFERENNVSNKLIVDKKELKSKGIKDKKGKEEGENDGLNSINWDYIGIDEDKEEALKCRVDTANNLNVLVLYSFGLTPTKTYNIMEKCLTIFNKNNYKIIVILNQNPGGYLNSAHYIIEGLQPYINMRFYVSLRDSGYLDKYEESNILDGLYDVSTYEEINYSNLKQKLHTETYGSTSIETSDALLLAVNREKVNKLKSILSNRRSPTDIIVFTDAFSYSAGSIFCKNMQINGGAILVGYNGNPVKETVFDSSQSHTAIIQYEEMDSLLGKLKKGSIINDLTDENAVISQLSFFPCFETYENVHTPIEYLVNEVDYRANIYEPFNEEIYDTFTGKAKQIFSEFETQCTEKNSKLTKFSESCSWSDDKDARGGYKCVNGKWSSSCVKIYCNQGQYLDPVENSCVSVSEEERNQNLGDNTSNPIIKKKSSSGLSNGAIAGIIIGGVVLIGAIIGGLCWCNNSSSRKSANNLTHRNSSVQSVENMNTQQMMPMTQSPQFYMPQQQQMFYHPVYMGQQPYMNNIYQPTNMVQPPYYMNNVYQPIAMPLQQNMNYVGMV